jgi:serine/threonine protein kinase
VAIRDRFRHPTARERLVDLQPQTGMMPPSLMHEGDGSIDSDIRTAVMSQDALPTVDVVREAERKLLESPPSHIGEYAILRTLGSGGMGIVFVGYDERLDRKVAVKLLRASVRDGDEGRARILREAQAMARLSHPNVVQVYDVGEHDGAVYVAMEFVAGETLREWSERPRPWREVVAVLVGAGRGLAAAHAEGLVHRDFKPDNVLVGKDGRPRVLDFGLARATNSDVDLAARDDPEPATDSQDPLGTEITRDGAVVGTPAYMSPQQHVGDPPDPRSDQFSFCVTAYETLYGKRPFRAGTRQELTGAMVNGAIVPPPTNTDVPSHVQSRKIGGRPWTSCSMRSSTTPPSPAGVPGSSLHSRLAQWHSARF